MCQTNQGISNVGEVVVDDLDQILFHYLHLT